MSVKHTIRVYDAAYGSWAISIRRQPLDSAQLAVRYDRIAYRWHRLCRKLDLPRAYETLLAKLPTPRSHTSSGHTYRVLDCGAGTGEFGLAFAKTCASTTELHAVDISTEMLTEAARRLDEAGVTAQLEHADVRSLPYPSDYFDIVMAAHVLEHLPDPLVALEEMRRVLKPGGQLVLSLTRRSLLGAYIHLKWRTHQLTPTTVQHWFDAIGMRCWPLADAPKGWLRAASLAFLGEKPILTRNMGTHHVEP